MSSEVFGAADPPAAPGNQGCICGECLSCRGRDRQRARRQAARESIETLAGSLLYNCKDRVRRASQRKKHYEYSLNEAWVVSQWDRQRGRCFYSGVPMTTTQSAKLVSIERLDCDKGYSPENCVLVCWQINMMRRRMPISEFVWWCQQVSLFAPNNPTQPQ